MKLYSVSDVFNAPWKCTTEAVWKKYPNEKQTSVKHIDVLDRRVTEDGRLLTTRLFGAELSFPSLIVSLLGLPDMCYSIEYSEMDLKSQTFILRTFNSTFSSFCSVDEKLVYSPSRDDPSRTELQQSYKVSAFNIPLAGRFEDTMIGDIKKNSAIGRSVVKNLVSTLSVENIIDRVTLELRELSQELALNANRIDDALSEKMAELAKDLDRASGMINNEIQHISHRVHSEMLQILDGLENELSQIADKVNLSQHGFEFESSKMGLLEAVMKAGITVNA